MGRIENIEKHKFKKDQSREKAAINGRKGGIASGYSKRYKRTLKMALIGQLNEEVELKGEKIQRIDKVTNGLLTRAESGDPNAVKLVAELIGEYRQNIEIGDADVGLIVEFVDDNEDQD